MKCTNCGVQNMDGAETCSGCGVQLLGTSASGRGVGPNRGASQVIPIVAIGLGLGILLLLFMTSGGGGGGGGTGGTSSSATTATPPSVAATSGIPGSAGASGVSTFALSPSERKRAVDAANPLVKRIDPKLLTAVPTVASYQVGSGGRITSVSYVTSSIVTGSHGKVRIPHGVIVSTDQSTGDVDVAAIN